MKEIPVRRLEARSLAQLSEEFNIRSMDTAMGAKDMVQPLHRHDHYFLLVLEQGKGSHACDFRSHELTPRTIYCMRPRQVHRLELKVGANGYFIQFKPEFLATGDPSVQHVLRRAGRMEVFQADPDHFTALLHLLDRIARECASGKEGHVPIVRAYFNAFLAELVLGAGASTAADEKSSYTRDRLEELLELIEAHVHSTKEVSAYAELMHLSTYQLNAIAKAGRGRTCSELITDQLLLEAKRYLLATTDQVNQVADRLGYDDPSYFIRFFRKHTGLTPEAFRQRSR